MREQLFEWCGKILGTIFFVSLGKHKFCSFFKKTKIVLYVQYIEIIS